MAQYDDVVRTAWESGQRNVCQIAREIGVDRGVVRRIVDRLGLQRDEPVLSEKKTDTPQDTAAHILKHLKTRRDQVVSMVALADRFDKGPKHIDTALSILSDEGYNIYIDRGFVGLTREDDAPQVSTVKVTKKDNVISFGALSDSHIGCKAERLDALNALYDWYDGEGIDTVYHAGNMLEGDARFNVRERYVHGIDQHVENFINKYPQKKGITTRFIAGDDHEGWFQQSAGISIGRHIENMAKRGGREDLEYLGYVEHDVEFKNPAGSFFMKVMHPGGGSAYALSYAPQKLVESFQGGEKPGVLLIGHYHKLEYLPALRGVHVIQTGCTCDQTAYLRKNKIGVHVGGWIVRLTQCPKTGAVEKANVECMTFFDRGFHQNFDRY